MHIPDKIYHATTWDKAKKIVHTSLKPKFGEIYFADTPAGSATFLAVRGVPLKDIVALEIDTSKIDKSLLQEGTDHNVVFFQDIQVFVYTKEIDGDIIENFYTFDDDCDPSGLL